MKGIRTGRSENVLDLLRLMVEHYPQSFRVGANRVEMFQSESLPSLVSDEI